MTLGLGQSPAELAWNSIRCKGKLVKLRSLRNLDCKNQEEHLRDDHPRKVNHPRADKMAQQVKTLPEQAW